jgi:putative membrane protein
LKFAPPIAHAVVQVIRTPLSTRRQQLRFVYIGLIGAFTALVLLFKIQNLETVTVSLFSASMTLSVSTLVLLIYVLGMLTGGFLWTLLRGLFCRATRPVR